MDLSVVIPVFNEASKVPRDILDALGYFEKNSINGEIIISDDGSKDNTGSLVKELQKNIGTSSYSKMLIEAKGQPYVKVSSGHKEMSYFLLTVEAAYLMLMSTRVFKLSEMGKVISPMPPGFILIVLLINLNHCSDKSYPVLFDLSSLFTWESKGAIRHAVWT